MIFLEGGERFDKGNAEKSIFGDILRRTCVDSHRFIFQISVCGASSFFTAFAAASLLYRPSVKISKALKIPYKAVAVCLTVLSVSAFMGIVGLVLWKTVSEIGYFAGETLGGENGLLDNIVGIFQRVGDMISSLSFVSGDNESALKESVTQAIADTVKNLFVSAASRFPAFAAKLVSAVPQIFIFFIVTVLSAVYLCVDYEKICDYVKRFLLWGSAISILIIIIYSIFGENILIIFTDNKDVLEYSKKFLYWILLIPITGFIAFLYDGILIGLTESIIMRNAIFISTLLFFIIYFTLTPLIGNNALWLAFLIYLLGRSLLMMLMSKSKIFIKN